MIKKETLNSPEIRLKEKGSWSLLKSHDVIPIGATKNNPNAINSETTVLAHL